MSFWIYKKGNDNKPSVYIVDTTARLLLLPIILGLFAGLICPKFSNNINGHEALIDYKTIIDAANFLMFSSCFLLLIAKISLCRKGIWFSFEPSRMSKIFRIIYYAAFILIFLGILPYTSILFL
jgi:hypothetical protein